VSPQGEALSRAQRLSKEETGHNVPPKASPLREKLSETRLFGTEFLTDVGDLPPPWGGRSAWFTDTFDFVMLTFSPESGIFFFR
jgi:hypothetical protein